MVSMVDQVLHSKTKITEDDLIAKFRMDTKMDTTSSSGSSEPPKMFTLKKWNAIATWSWDVECDTCAICRVQLMGAFLLRAAVPCCLAMIRTR